jgi:hypothetical protein
MMIITRRRPKQAQINFSTPKISFPTANKATNSIQSFASSNWALPSVSVSAFQLGSFKIRTVEDCCIITLSFKGGNKPLATRKSSHSSDHFQKLHPLGYITEQTNS